MKNPHLKGKKKKSAVQLKSRVYLALKLYGQVCLDTLRQWEHLPFLSGNSGPFSRQRGGKGTNKGIKQSQGYLHLF